MSNEKELKEGVIPYLDERIEGQRRLVREAERRLRNDKSEWNEKIAHAYEYGLNLLKGVKRDISK